MSEEITSALESNGGNGSEPQTQSSAPATTGAWHESMGFDADTVGWLENRGLTKMDTKEALKNSINGFRSAEKYLGVPKDQLLRIPNFEKAEQSELNSFYDRLGRPNDPKGYNIELPEGASPEFADWAKGMFHEAGVPARQAEKIAAKWNERMGGQMEQSKQEQVQRSQEQQQNLAKEWGDAFEQQTGFAKQAAGSLGISPEQIDALQQTMGYDGVMKFFANIGEKMGEPAYVGGSGGNDNAPMTPQRAQAQIKELQSDREWTAKYLAGNADARAKMDRLMKQAYPSN